nr:hypothetical protein [Tanacetum cinerariifolium]
MGKSSRNKKRAMENLNFFYHDIGTSSSAGGHLTQEEVAKEALAIRMSQKFALLKEERPIIKRIGYHDKYKKILDEIWKDKVDLDGKIIKEEEEAVERIKGEALKEKDDIGAFRVTTLIAKFLILDILIDCDSPIVVGRGFLRMIDGIVNTPKRLFLTFDGFCHQTFHAARSDVMRNAKSDSDDEEDYQIKRNKLDHHDSNALDNMKPWRKHWFHKFTMNFCYGKVDLLREAGSDEEIFTSVAWVRAFNINELIYTELCHEFYSTYEFDEVCADDELQTEKFIKFRLGGRAHSLTLLEFARRTTGYDKIQKNDLWLLSIFNAKHQNGYANAAWLIARWIKRKGAGTQKESQICCGRFISKIARKSRVLTLDVLRSLSGLVYYRDLDTTTLRELIDSESRLIPDDVPRVGIPRPPRASMQDLYDRMGRMEIRQEAIKRMEYR